jgi:hypothetical protein
MRASGQPRARDADFDPLDATVSHLPTRLGLTRTRGADKEMTTLRPAQHTRKSLGLNFDFVGDLTTFDEPKTSVAVRGRHPDSAFSVEADPVGKYTGTFRPLASIGQ